MRDAVRHIVILGGGSAGWLTAAVLAAGHVDPNDDSGIRVTLIESPDVPTIGVGEGTWPTMRDTLRKVGISETEFIRQCDATFKQGSQFVGWSTGGPEDSYYHPFVLPQGYLEADLVAEWASRHREVPFAKLVSFQPHLCDAGKAPKQFATPEYAAVANYAYHLDAGKLGVFLREHCVGKLGVRHVVDHMIGIRSHDNGDIASLQTRDHGGVEGDLFIDCTGMRALLIGQHYGIAALPRKDVLFNDRAIALQVGYATPDEPIACQTVSTAQRSGWIWDIGLQHRRGLGHVYSSTHSSDEEAEQALLAHLRATGGREQDILRTNRLSINPGYRRKSWHHNCVAIGLSSGFMEPLEASSLVLVELAAGMLSDELPATRQVMDLVARRFNDAFDYRWERVVDFLKLHYVLSQRQDSDYWRDNRRNDTVPERLRELLEIWRFKAPSRYDLPRVDEVFPSASYQYVLYGMGFRPEARPAGRRKGGSEQAQAHYREAADLARRMLGALPTHRGLIDHINTRGMPRI